MAEGVVSGARFLRLWFPILLNGRQPCCWENNWFLILYRTLALFAGEMSCFAQALALVVCGSSQYAACTHPCKRSTAVLLLTVQACFVFVGKVYVTSQLCYLRDRRWVSAFVLFWLYELLLLYYLLWEEGRQLSCSEKIRHRLLLGELLKLSWVSFVKNKNLESFSGILGDP